VKKGIVSNLSIAALTILCLVLASCAHISLIAPYDERIEKGITELQKETTAFFVKVERQGGSNKDDYSKHTEFYDKSKVATKSLMIRAGATAQNKRTEQQIKLLMEKYDKLENQHKTEGLTSYTVAPLESSFDDIFRAILTLEVAKKDLKEKKGE
jgi:hypothetical protein